MITIFPTHLQQLKARQVKVAEEIIELELEKIRVEQRVIMLKAQDAFLEQLIPHLPTKE